MSKILVIYHTLSGNTEAAAEYIAQGAREIADEVEVKLAKEADAEDLRSCGAIAVGTPDYFSYMAGMVKDFFDRTYYPTQGQVAGKPCVIFVTHGGGGRAKDSIQSICDSFEFDVLTGPVMIKNSPEGEDVVSLKDAGRKLARACDEN